jgi:hypothetical protein
VSPRLPTVPAPFLTAAETMMSQLSSLRRHVLVIVFFAALLLTHTACAASERAVLDLPVLWGEKSWMIGYALLFLGILLGMLALLIPSMRKVLRKKD